MSEYGEVEYVGHAGMPNWPQKVRIVNYFGPGGKNPDIVNERVDSPHSHLNYDMVLKQFAKGEIGEKEITSMLKVIPTPLDLEKTGKRKPDLTYDQIKAWPRDERTRMHTLIASLVTPDVEKIVVGPKHFFNLIEKYPLPSDYQREAQRLLHSFDEKGQAGLIEKRQYEESIRQLGHKLYGKRWEYHVQLGSLRDEADKTYPEIAQARKESEKIEK